MRQEYDLINIESIRDGFVFYLDNGVLRKIDVKESARSWWEKINSELNQMGYWLFDEG